MGRRNNNPLWKEILKEADVYSINRVLPFALFIISNLIFWSVIIVLFVNNTFFGGKPFSGLGELCTAYLTVQSLIACWLTGNKFTNSKYNTHMGEPGKPMNSPIVENIERAVTSMADRVNGSQKEATDDKRRAGDSVPSREKQD